MEGIPKSWVEEAETVAERSWEILIPTIRLKVVRPKHPVVGIKGQFRANRDADMTAAQSGELNS